MAPLGSNQVLSWPGFVGRSVIGFGFDSVTAWVMAQVGRGALVRNGPVGSGGPAMALSDGEKVALLAPDLQGLLDARGVPEDLQARLYDAGVGNLPMLSAIAVDRNSLEALAKDSLGLDVTVRARDAIKLASLYLAWPGNRLRRGSTPRTRWTRRPWPIRRPRWSHRWRCS